MNVAALAADLRAAAARTNHRRLLVLAGDRDIGIDAAFDAIEGADIPDDETTIVTTREGFRFDRVEPKRARELLGTTRAAVILDAHEGFSPNALGRLVGSVDGGGLLILLAPPLDSWPAHGSSFESSLAVPPYDIEDVGGRFRARLVATLRDHPGIAVVDVDTGTVERRGEADDASGHRSTPAVPQSASRRFPRAAYDACLTADQSHALHALEALDRGGDDRRGDDHRRGNENGTAVVVEADRGRGKSSAAGLAAGSLAAAGRDVLVTAPDRRNAEDLFARARELVSALGVSAGETDSDTSRTTTDSDTLRTACGGQVRYLSPPDAAALPGDPDVVLVDEAAALPVRLLSALLDAPAIGFFTTVHGYEGAGRGFSVRFRDRLEASDHDVTDVTLTEPIRYAPGDPIESWAFRALLLDARPPVDALVADASPSTVEYRALSAGDLDGDEHLLRAVFGLLVFAHYRTEPNDLARLLDAPNLRVRILEHDGHVVSVALLAREGDLDAESRKSVYEGSRIRGNMIPDVLTSQLRDEDAGTPLGYRVVRIATHHAVRSRGLGSTLLTEIRAEFDGEADYLGTGYGATPELLDFWADNGFSTAHLSTTRNHSSGEYSVVMLSPLSAAGRELRDRHARLFRNRIGDVLVDQLRDADPDIVRGALAGCPASVSPTLSEYEWRVVVGVADGPGQYATAPGAFRRLALAALLGDDEDGDTGREATEPTATLPPRQERLLVRKILQAQPGDTVADELGYVSTRECLRALGAAYASLVDRYGDSEVVGAERARFGRNE
ncbi:tRNA(Met) cytidine acetyltransferase TmcA [Halobellus captivus]|uniref:tRNA(Met) cytidine acetyltransferase TmcA n=1 Tax=Halobellus captivus TaxID=2592614 RepID=UPI0011A7E16F|nr:tRNA(Met) cytidine acetyltransferase TmcA [Halobellus captivus]